MNLARGLLALLATTFLPASLPAADKVEHQPDREINALLEPIRRKHDVPALAAAIVRGKGLLAVGAVGERKRGSGIPITVDDKFHLGSDTKAMTAMLIARLVEEGKLSYDDTLAKRFAELAASMSPAVRDITLTDLLSHHSGLAYKLENEPSAKQDLREQRQEVVKRVAALKMLDSKPGTHFTYSNWNYVLAGHMAERILDKPWEDLLTERIFKPLHMSGAGFGPMAAKDQVDEPWGHNEKGEPANKDNPAVLGPAGRVHAALADWARFIADHIKGGRGEKALLKPGTYQLLHRSAFEDHAYTRGGWIGGDKKPPTGKYVLGHDGSNLLNYATAWVAPSRDFAVLVVANQGGEEAKKACHEASQQLRKKYLKDD